MEIISSKEFKEKLTYKNNDELIEYIIENFKVSEAANSSGNGNGNESKLTSIKKFCKKKLQAFYIENIVVNVNESNYEEISELDLITINHAIARMDIIIENFSNMSFMSVIISVFTFFLSNSLSIINDFTKENFADASGLLTVANFLVLLAIAIVLLSLMSNFRQAAKEKAIAIYMKKILENIKIEKADKKKKEIRNGHILNRSTRFNIHK